MCIYISQKKKWKMCLLNGPTLFFHWDPRFLKSWLNLIMASGCSPGRFNVFSSAFLFGFPLPGFESGEFLCNESGWHLFKQVLDIALCSFWSVDRFHLFLQMFAISLASCFYWDGVHCKTILSELLIKHEASLFSFEGRKFFRVA